MSDNVTLREGLHQLSPHLVCAGAADAIEFYKAAFGAEELVRLAGPDGKLMHACVSINGSSVMLVDENLEWGLRSPKALNGTPVTIHLVVPDVDAWFAKAVDAGATVAMPVDDMFWGDRYGIIQDPFGHLWAIATPQRDLTGAELADAASAAMSGGN
ncbi:MAG TPA: VOC family protein [Ilumatobacteraceae bacterium]